VCILPRASRSSPLDRVVSAFSVLFGDVFFLFSNTFPLTLTDQTETLQIPFTFPLPMKLLGSFRFFQPVRSAFAPPDVPCFQDPSPLFFTFPHLSTSRCCPGVAIIAHRPLIAFCGGHPFTSGKGIVLSPSPLSFIGKRFPLYLNFPPKSPDRFFPLGVFFLLTSCHPPEDTFEW